jgi:hypothetical protein
VIFGVDPVNVQFQDFGIYGSADELVLEFDIVFEKLNDKRFLLGVHQFLFPAFEVSLLAQGQHSIGIQRTLDIFYDVFHDGLLLAEPRA